MSSYKGSLEETLSNLSGASSMVVYGTIHEVEGGYHGHMVIGVTSEGEPFEAYYAIPLAGAQKGIYVRPTPGEVCLVLAVHASTQLRVALPLGFWNDDSLPFGRYDDQRLHISDPEGVHVFSGDAQTQIQADGGVLIEGKGGLTVDGSSGLTVKGSEGATIQGTGGLTVKSMAAAATYGVIHNNLVLQAQLGALVTQLATLMGVLSTVTAGTLNQVNAPAAALLPTLAAILTSLSSGLYASNDTKTS